MRWLRPSICDYPRVCDLILVWHCCVCACLPSYVCCWCSVESRRCCCCCCMQSMLLCAARDWRAFHSVQPEIVASSSSLPHTLSGWPPLLVLNLYSHLLRIRSNSPPLCVIFGSTLFSGASLGCVAVTARTSRRTSRSCVSRPLWRAAQLHSMESATLSLLAFCCPTPLAHSHTHCLVRLSVRACDVCFVLLWLLLHAHLWSGVCVCWPRHGGTKVNTHRGQAASSFTHTLVHL